MPIAPTLAAKDSQLAIRARTEASPPVYRGTRRTVSRSLRLS